MDLNQINTIPDVKNLENNTDPIENVVLTNLISSMNEEEQLRFNNYRESKFPIIKIKKTIQQYFGNVSLSESTQHILASACKVYAGELIELSKEIMEEKGEKGAILPYHLKEAKRRQELSNKEFNKQELDYFFD